MTERLIKGRAIVTSRQYHHQCAQCEHLVSSDDKGVPQLAYQIACDQDECTMLFEVW